MSGAALAFEDISHHYGAGPDRVDVLVHVTFDVPAGTVACVVGPSGCGKSTLLSLAAGLARPSAGAVRWDGREVKLGPNFDLGMAFQQPGLFPWLTVRQNVAIGLRTRGKAKAEALATADEFLGTVGLSEFLDAYPSQLSGGMAQRVGIARALALRPRLLLMDEPFAAVDAFTRIKLQQDLKALLKQQAPQFVKGKLTLNCRNSRNIGEETALMSGFSSPPYRMGQISGLPVDYRYYTSHETQQTVLTEALKRLLGEGVKPSDIVVLSRLRLENSGLAGLNGGDHFRLFEADGSAVAKSRVPLIRFSTVHAFKGMESPVVVLCDIEQVTDGDPQCLLYVAMSRARSHLTVLVHQNARAFIGECVRRKLEEQWSRNK